MDDPGTRLKTAIPPRWFLWLKKPGGRRKESRRAQVLFLASFHFATGGAVDVKL